MRQYSDFNYDSSLEEPRRDDIDRRRENLLIVKIIAAVVIIASALLVLFFIGTAIQENKNGSYAVIYSKSGSEFLKGTHGEFALKTEKISETVTSKDGNRLFYLTKSAYGSNKLDLYCCDLNKKSRIAKGGFIVDYGIESGFSINDDGSFAVYSKKNDETGEVVWYLYNTEKKKASEIESNILELFLLPVDKAAYFTKTQGSNTALFKVVFGSAPTKIADSATNVFLFKSKDQCVLLYEAKKASETAYKLYMITGLGGQKLISADVSDVLYNDYTAGGNLYFFKANKATTDWRGIIEDDLAAQDKLITEPQKSDYLFFFGYSYGYTRAMNLYNSKLSRDELRTALDKLVMENNLIAAQMDCYVYNTKGTVKIGDDVPPGRVYAVTASGEPRIIYNKDIYIQSDVNFSKLYAMLDYSNMSEVTAYASELITNSTVSKGINIAFSDCPQGISLDIDNGEVKNCVFDFSLDGNKLYIILKDDKGTKSTFYETDILNNSLSQRKVIDTGIADNSYSGGVLWYLKRNSGMSEGTLYKYSDGNSVKISDSVYSFICFDDSSVLLFRNYKQVKGELSADLYYCKNNNSVLIDKNVALNRLRYHGSQDLAYIRNYSNDTGGELCVYKNEKIRVIDSGVDEILLY